MTVNINALINSIGKTYQELIDDGIISYKTKPTGYPGDSDLTLDMAREGVHLAFKRDGGRLWSVILRIQHDKLSNWEFPNELPPRFQKIMSRKWVHEKLGMPLRSVPPKVIMKRSFGWTDLYETKETVIPAFIQISYDVQDNVRAIAYISAEELRW